MSIIQIFCGINGVIDLGTAALILYLVLTESMLSRFKAWDWIKFALLVLTPVLKALLMAWLVWKL